MSEDYNIHLHFDRKHLEELYFPNGEDGFFTNKEIRMYLVLFLVLAVCLAASIIYWVAVEERIEFMVLSIVFTLLSAWQLFEHWMPIRKWIRRTKKFIDKSEKCKEYVLTLTPVYFSLRIDGTENIEKWDVVNSVGVYEDHIWIEGRSVYIFPKKSMTDAEYASIRSMIPERVKAN